MTIFYPIFNRHFMSLVFPWDKNLHCIMIIYFQPIHMMFSLPLNQPSNIPQETHE